MGTLTRCIANDGSLTVLAADTTDVVNEAQRVHGTYAVTSAALGRLLTAAAFFGAALKGEDHSVTLRIQGDGPAGVLLAVADAKGGVKGYVEQPMVEIARKPNGKLDVSGAVGKTGTLSVMRDIGQPQPYIGQIELVSGEIAEDITQYYAVSEQIPTACGLGVLVNPAKDIQAAGGYLVQLLPGAGEDTIAAVERCLQDVPPVSTLLQSGKTPQEICRAILPEFTLELLEESPITYHCDCTAQRVERVLRSLGKEELTKIAEEEEVVEVNCQFCTKTYRYTSEQVQELLKSKP